LSYSRSIRRDVLPVSADDLPWLATHLLDEGHRLALAAVHDDGPTLRVVYLFLAAAPDRRVELHVTVPVGQPEVPSLAHLSFPSGRFEREMHDLYGVIHVGHPLPRRLVRHAHWPAGWYPMRHDAGRIREQLMRLNHTVTGHRLLRGGIQPGGVTLHALPDPDQLIRIAADVAELTLANNVIRDRFTGTAILSNEQARDIGCLGYVARASGLANDARIQHPFVELPITEASASSGDVLDRYE
jgi:Ni,Fe-hydrogenase III component G